MSLKNVQLPPIVISNLYKYYLVDSNSDLKKPEMAKAANLFFGDNYRDIFLIVINIEASFLPGNQLEFLSGILSACKLNLSDVTIINLNKTAKKEIPELLKAFRIIAFGIKASALGLPFSIPEFQVQLFNNQTYLFVPELEIILKEADLKRKLWVSLKEVFSVKT